MMWWIVGGVVLVLFLVFIYSLCRIAAMADLHQMSRSARFTEPPDPNLKLYGGVYDAVNRGDFDE